MIELIYEYHNAIAPVVGFQLPGEPRSKALARLSRRMVNALASMAKGLDSKNDIYDPNFPLAMMITENEPVQVTGKTANKEPIFFINVQKELASIAALKEKPSETK